MTNERSSEWDFSGAAEGLPRLEEKGREEAAETLPRVKTPPKRIRFLEPPSAAATTTGGPRLPTLQRRSSLLAYDPIIVRFLKNGDSFFEGVKLSITQRTVRSWDMLLMELSRRIDLPAGVRNIYTPKRGHKIKSLSQLEHHKIYVCGSTEPFRKMNYEKVKNPDWKTTHKIRASESGTNSVFGSSFPLFPFDPNASANLNASSSRNNMLLNASMRSNVSTEEMIELSASTNRPRRMRRPKRLSRLSSIISEPGEKEETAFEDPPPPPPPPHHHHQHTRRVTIQSPLPSLPSGATTSNHLALTIITNMPPPRDSSTVYINKSLVVSWEDAKQLIAENLKSVNGCLRLFSLIGGGEVESLSQLWKAGDTLVAVGNETFNLKEFLLGGPSRGSASSANAASLSGEKSAVPPVTSSEDNSKFPPPTSSPGKEAAESKHDEESTADGESGQPHPPSLPKSPTKENAEAEKLEDSDTPKPGVNFEVKYQTSDESNSSPEREHRKKRKSSRGGHKHKSKLFSDSSSSSLHHQQSLQNSPTFSAAIMFPPTPTSETPIRRHRRPCILDNIKPFSVTSSPMESPLLRASYKSPLGKGYLPHPQTPQSEISLGVIPSVVDMLLLDSKNSHTHETSSNSSSFGGSHPPTTSRTVAIQTTYVDDHLSTQVEPEENSERDGSPPLSQETGQSQADEVSTQDLMDVSAAASQLYKHTREKYHIGMAILEGNFTSIKYCTEKEEGKEFILKVVHRARVFGRDDKVVQEIEIMRLIRHENVLTVRDYWETTNEMCMVMESIEGGDLFDAILHCQHFCEADAIEAMRQLGLALVYLHANNIVHRGIKPENIFLSLELGSGWTLKLAGFSLATRMSEPLTLICGNEHYRAPEMVTGKGYGTKIDVWSAGIIAYILLSGTMPFKKSRSLHRKLTFPSAYWENVSSEAKDFISHLLIISPQDRYSSSHLMQHPWLKKSLRKDPEHSKKLIEYLIDQAAMKVASVPILTLTALDHESNGQKRAVKKSRNLTSQTITQTPSTNQ